ncbi:hypothetical protein BLJAPNOD_01271 [Ensifer sp. M14]|nr:hypothetical protein [Ensifer sp. M14]RDL50153.1 hypothetical protein BLJAPNOD_01271 [Ensifer sp. M14]
MPKPNPSKDPEHLKLKLPFMEASAIGRFPIACVFLLAVLVIGGMAAGVL